MAGFRWRPPAQSGPSPHPPACHPLALLESLPFPLLTDPPTLKLATKTWGLTGAMEGERKRSRKTVSQFEATSLT